MVLSQYPRTPITHYGINRAVTTCVEKTSIQYRLIERTVDVELSCSMVIEFIILFKVAYFATHSIDSPMAVILFRGSLSITCLICLQVIVL